MRLPLQMEPKLVRKKTLYPLTYRRTHLEVEIVTPRGKKQVLRLPVPQRCRGSVESMAYWWGFKPVWVSDQYFIQQKHLEPIARELDWAFAMAYDHPRSVHHTQGLRSLCERLEISH